MDNRPIGFLDSGVGGLTVVRELKTSVCLTSLLFILVILLGLHMVLDQQDKSENIHGSWLKFLLTKDVKMIVIACNTATAVVWEEIKEALDIPVLGVVLPGSSAAIKSSQSGQIGVIGTPMTIASNIYEQKN